MKPRCILPSKTKYGKVITCFVVLKVCFKVKKMVAQSLYCFHRTRIKSDEKSWAWYLCIGHFYHCWQWLISFSINRIIVIVSQREVTLKITIAFTLQDVYTRESVKQWTDRVFFSQGLMPHIYERPQDPIKSQEKINFEFKMVKTKINFIESNFVFLNTILLKM